jgi:hypothetical protein
MIARAVEDAMQDEDLALQQEALAWLWVCCPDLADQLELPYPQDSGAAGEHPEMRSALSPAYQTVLAYAQRPPMF